MKKLSKQGYFCLAQETVLELEHAESRFLKAITNMHRMLACVRTSHARPCKSMLQQCKDSISAIDHDNGFAVFSLGMIDFGADLMQPLLRMKRTNSDTCQSSSFGDTAIVPPAQPCLLPCLHLRLSDANRHTSSRQRLPLLRHPNGNWVSRLPW